MIHSGAVVAAGVSQGRSTSLKRDFKVSVRSEFPFRQYYIFSSFFLSVLSLLELVKSVSVCVCRSLNTSGETPRKETLFLLERLLEFRPLLEHQLVKTATIPKQNPNMCFDVKPS